MLDQSSTKIARTQFSKLSSGYHSPTNLTLSSESEDECLEGVPRLTFGNIDRERVMEIGRSCLSSLMSSARSTPRGERAADKHSCSHASHAARCKHNKHHTRMVMRSLCAGAALDPPLWSSS